MKVIVHLSTLLLLFIVLSCGNYKKSKLQGVDFEWKSGVVKKYDAVSYKKPCFNPNNSDEFVCYYKDENQGIHQLVKYNLKTKKKKILAKNLNFHGQPKWGKNDVIAFSTEVNFYTFKLYLINSDGSDLAEQIASKYEIHYSWDRQGEYLHVGTLRKFYRISKNEIIIDDSDNKLDVYDISDNYILGVFSGGLMYYDYEERPDIYLTSMPLRVGYFELEKKYHRSNFYNLVRYDDVYYIKDLKWHPSETFLFASTHQIKGSHNFEKYNINKIYLDRSKEIFLKCYDSRNFGHLSCSQDGKWLLIECDDAEYEHPNLKIKSSIYLVNTKSKKGRKLKLN